MGYSNAWLISQEDRRRAVIKAERLKTERLKTEERRACPVSAFLVFIYQAAVFNLSSFIFHPRSHAAYKTIRDIDVAGKRVLIRVDFNVRRTKRPVHHQSPAHRGRPADIQYALDTARPWCSCPLGGRWQGDRQVQPPTVARNFRSCWPPGEVPAGLHRPGGGESLRAGALKPGDVCSSKTSASH